MKENKNIKQQIKDFWSKNKQKIKVGVICLVSGLAIGYVKAFDDIKEIKVSFDVADKDKNNADNNYGLTAENCDDPELLEMVKSGELNI